MCYIINNMFFGKKCPSCDSRNIKTIKGPSALKTALRGRILSEWLHPTKPLNVCRDCKFSWEDR